MWMPSPISAENMNIEINQKKINGGIVDFGGISHFVVKSSPDFDEYEKVMDIVKSKIES